MPIPPRADLIILVKALEVGSSAILELEFKLMPLFFLRFLLDHCFQTLGSRLASLHHSHTQLEENLLTGEMSKTLLEGLASSSL